MPGDDDRKQAETTFSLTGGFDAPEDAIPPPGRYLKPGTLLAGNYLIEAVIGEGGMGIVYRALDATLSRLVAIKTLHSNLLGDDGIRRRFVREDRQAVRIVEAHPHLSVRGHLDRRGRGGRLRSFGRRRRDGRRALAAGEGGEEERGAGEPAQWRGPAVSFPVGGHAADRSPVHR